jgi:cathepsin A (carboxypeptidase C)
LNGGPGCSSSTGLLFELGPCSIAKNVTSSTTSAPFTTYNPFSWTEHANILFLDQPVNVGFSYSSDGSTASNSPAAAKDVWAFLELFLTRFPEYAEADFHIAAESYGGHYAPNIASVVHKKNKEIQETGNVGGFTEINLKSVILANGITEPYTQFGTIPEFLCNGPYPVLDNDGPKCAELRSKVPTCQRLVKACYHSGSRFSWYVCSAFLFCLHSHSPAPSRIDPFWTAACPPGFTAVVRSGRLFKNSGSTPMTSARSA